MKRSRLYFGILILILLLVIVWASYNMLTVRKSEESYRVSVIVDNSSSDRWIPMRQGLEQAAEDYNIDLNFVFTSSFLNVKEQMELINLEIENGAEGIMVQVVSSEECLDELGDISAKAALMLLETDVYPEDVYTLTGPDNAQLGRIIGKAVIDEFGIGLKEKKIGILCGNQKLLSMQQRLAGVEEVLLAQGADIIWKTEHISEKEGNGTEYGQVDIIIALENEETERMVDDIQRNCSENSEFYLYGVGCSEKVVYYLDKGLINTLVVPNEFSMGYQSMETIAKQLRYHLADMENGTVDSFVVDKESLYDEENQKVLFPIVQ